MVVSGNTKHLAVADARHLGIAVIKAGVFLDRVFDAAPERTCQAIAKSLSDLTKPPYSLAELVAALRATASDLKRLGAATGAAAGAVTATGTATAGRLMTDRGSTAIALGFMKSGSASRSWARCWRISFSAHSTTVSRLRILSSALNTPPAPILFANFPCQVGNWSALIRNEVSKAFGSGLVRGITLSLDALF
jgi:hypothetical protein